MKDDFLEEPGDDSMVEGFILSMNNNKGPFNLYWEDDEMELFLKKRGYTFNYTFNKEEEKVKVASNQSKGVVKVELSEAFETEIKSIILKWLLKIGKNNG